MLDDFDIGPQSDEWEDTPEMMDVEDDSEYDDGFADEMELGAEGILSAYDDDPSPYDGTYSEM